MALRAHRQHGNVTRTLPDQRRGRRPHRRRLFGAQRLIVEIDSWEFHKDRRAFETDRTRDADTLQAGHRTIRLTDDRMRDQADAEAARLHRLLSAPPAPGG